MVNCHNCRIWGTENPHVMVEQERDSPKVNVFCAISLQRLYGPFFFTETTVTGDTYLEMLRNWLMPQLTEESEGFIFPIFTHTKMSFCQTAGLVEPDRRTLL
jgi:hypothetical protein